MKQIRNRLAWLMVAIVTVSFSLFLIITPTLSAQSSSSVEVKNYLARFQYIFQYILQAYVDEVDPKQLYEGALNGMFDTLDDPWSYYLSEDDMEDLNNNTTVGRYGGVGLYIARPVPVDEKDKGKVMKIPDQWPELDTTKEDLPFIKVVSPIEDTPAYRKGIHSGDYIIAIGDQSTENMTSDDASGKMKGLPGTDVTVTILRGKNIIFDVTITRASIEIPTVKEAMIPGRIGYIRIIQFSPYTEPRVREALKTLNSQGYDSLIIDVRGNGGGLLNAAVNIIDMFLSSGPIVSTKGRIAEENKVFNATSSLEVAADVPIAILIDGGSASASEILAGAFKDTGRGYLIGNTSFGKGLVQTVVPLGREGFKLTISRYYTPSGVNINGTGIEPNLKIAEPELNDEENASLKKLFEEHLVENFVNGNPKPSEQEQKAFARRLKQEEEITLPFDLLMRLIRGEVFRRMDQPPVYDLDYDPVLKKAVSLLETGAIQPTTGTLAQEQKQ